MKNGLVIADSGPIFSLAIIDKLQILDSLFEEVKIPNAVWKEIIFLKSVAHYAKIYDFFERKTEKITGSNELSILMDLRESEAIILYKELGANFLLIDDRKAQKIAENFGVKCIGTIGLLAIAKEKNFISELKPIFKIFLRSKRYYSLDLLNHILEKVGESRISRHFLNF